MASILYSPKGVYGDRLIRAGDVVMDRGLRSNIVVDEARVLIAAFMRGDGPAGIEVLRIGRGLSEWDTNSPDSPAGTMTGLVDPSPFDIAVTRAMIEYLDAGGAPTTTPTHRIRLVVTLGENEPPDEDPYPLREFGLFGSLGGDEYMINYVRHAVINKQGDDTLERTIQLVF